MTDQFRKDLYFNPQVEVDSLTGFNVADPVQLIVIMALRTGDLSPTDSVAQLFEQASRTETGTLSWNYPERPLLFAFTGAIAYEKPAMRYQIHDTLKKAARLTDLPNKNSLILHDLRRGAARQLSRLISASGNRDEERTGTILGHTKNSTRMGTTAMYIGHETKRVWGERLAENGSPGEPLDKHVDPSTTENVDTYLNQILESIDSVNPSSVDANEEGLLQFIEKYSRIKADAKFRKSSVKPSVKVVSVLNQEKIQKWNNNPYNFL